MYARLIKANRRFGFRAKIGLKKIPRIQVVEFKDENSRQAVGQLSECRLRCLISNYLIEANDQHSMLNAEGYDFFVLFLPACAIVHTVANFVLYMYTLCAY